LVCGLLIRSAVWAKSKFSWNSLEKGLNGTPEIVDQNGLAKIYRTTKSPMPVTKPEPRYDVFISYRRGAVNALALLLQTQLQRQGIAAFLDRDLRRGVFDDMLHR
jgi:hypothetical protein